MADPMYEYAVVFYVPARGHWAVDGVDVEPDDDRIALLNRLGHQGWRVVSTAHDGDEVAFTLERQGPRTTSRVW